MNIKDNGGRSALRNCFLNFTRRCQIIENTKRYSIIYADPPWQYRQKNISGAAEHHYKTMSVDEICKLNIDEITADDSVLFLWTTFPQLPEALKVIRAWGFQYKTVGFVWLKQNKSGSGWFFGLGFWTRGNAEICLFSTKGKPHRNSNRVHQFIISPLREHSRKPDEAREKIIELMGDIPRLEMFAREKKAGWDAWGNEILCDIEINRYPDEKGGGLRVR
jgi:site-specific DNA-methyltransferase (adenine-specific)